MCRICMVCGWNFMKFRSRLASTELYERRRRKNYCYCIRKRKFIIWQFINNNFRLATAMVERKFEISSNNFSLAYFWKFLETQKTLRYEIVNWIFNLNNANELFFQPWLRLTWACGLRFEVMNLLFVQNSPTVEEKVNKTTLVKWGETCKKNKERHQVSLNNSAKQYTSDGGLSITSTVVGDNKFSGPVFDKHHHSLPLISLSWHQQLFVCLSSSPLVCVIHPSPRASAIINTSHMFSCNLQFSFFYTNWGNLQIRTCRSNNLRNDHIIIACIYNVLIWW